MSIPYTIPWATMKSLKDYKGYALYHVTGDASTNSYDVFATNHVHYFQSPVSGIDPGTSGKDFKDNYITPGKTTAVADFGDFLAQSILPSNAQLVPQVEIVSRTGKVGFQQYTICSFNFCKKSTWFQNYDEYVDQAMEPDVPLSYTTYKLTLSVGKTPWINIDDFSIPQQEYARGAPNYGQAGVWMRDGTLAQKTAWRPVIKKNGVVLTSGYTLDYALGRATFSPALISTDVVTASFRTPKAIGGSEFVLRPRPGKRLSIPHTEINLTEEIQINSAVVFEVWAGDPTWTMGGPGTPYYLQYSMEYKSMAQIFGLSVVGADRYPSMGGTGVVAASAENGWSTDQKRGLANGLIEIPYDFGIGAGWGRVIDLRADQFAQVRAYIRGDMPLTGEYCSVSLYCEESDL